MTLIIHQPDSCNDLSAFELLWLDFIYHQTECVLRMEKNLMDWELRERDAKYNILDFYVGSSILLEFL